MSIHISIHMSTHMSTHMSIHTSEGRHKALDDDDWLCSHCTGRCPADSLCRTRPPPTRNPHCFIIRLIICLMVMCSSGHSLCL